MHLLGRQPETNAEQVFETLERNRLKPESTMIMGGAALALHGIRNASDVDLMVPGAEYFAMARQHATEGGHPLKQKATIDQPFLTSAKSGWPLKLDITQPQLPPLVEGDPEQLFASYLSECKRIDGYGVLNLNLIKQHKQAHRRLKDRRDIKKIDQHLEGDS